MEHIKRNLSVIENKINSLKSHRLFNNNITIIAVSKFQEIDAIEKAIKAGITNFGENYIQEAEEKWIPLKKKYPHIKLHLIGKLQRNKVKNALQIFDVIHSIDSLKLIQTISTKLHNAETVTKEFLIQVNLDNEKEEQSRSGINPLDLPNILQNAINLNMQISGFMAVLPTKNLGYPYFGFLKKLQQQYKVKNLSMGMSADFEESVIFGSTMIRIGTAIFGERKQ